MKQLMKQPRLGLFTALVSACSASLLLYPALSNGQDSDRRVTQLQLDKIGQGLTITSWVRSCSHPAERVKGHCNGTHVRGMAVDIACIKDECLRIADLAEEAGFTGVITYSRHIHLDNRLVPYQGVGNYDKPKR